MAHWPIGGPGGSLNFCAAEPDRVYIHINNTNPILHEDRKERRAVVDAGIEIIIWALSSTERRPKQSNCS